MLATGGDVVDREAGDEREKNVDEDEAANRHTGYTHDAFGVAAIASKMIARCDG